MSEGINLTAYIILTVLLYLYLVLFAAINIFSQASAKYIKLKKNIYSALTQNDGIKKFLASSKKGFLPLRSHFIKLLVYLQISCEGLYEFEKTWAPPFNSALTEPVDYLSLIIRKLYEGNSQLYIVYSAFAIVVFYFILTIF